MRFGPAEATRGALLTLALLALVSGARADLRRERARVVTGEERRILEDQTKRAATTTPPAKPPPPVPAATPAPPPTSPTTPPPPASSSEDDVGFGGPGLTKEVPAGEAPPDAAAGPPEAASAKEWSLSARYRLRGALWTERSSPSILAQARNALDLQLTYQHRFASGSTFRVLADLHGEVDPTYLIDRDRYDVPTREAYEWQVFSREAYASYETGPFQVAAGRMIVPFGQGEVLGSLDVANPRDLREPGLTAAEDLRMAVLMGRLAVAAAPHRFELLVIPESYFGLQPPPLAPLSPLRKLLVEDPLSGAQLATYRFRYDHQPGRFDAGALQAIVHYGYAGHALDLDVYAGTLLDKLGVPGAQDPRAFYGTDVDLVIVHPRYTLAATSGSFTTGPFLLRWELGAEIGKAQTLRRTDSLALRFDVERETQFNGLLGATYFGIPNGTVGLEFAQSYVPEAPEHGDDPTRRLLWPVELPSGALRYTQELFDQRVEVNLIAVTFGVAPFGGALLRGEASYLFTDGLRAGLGYAHYFTSERFGPFYGFEDNDRALLTLAWDFGIF